MAITEKPIPSNKYAGRSILTADGVDAIINIIAQVRKRLDAHDTESAKQLDSVASELNSLKGGLEENSRADAARLARIEDLEKFTNTTSTGGNLTNIFSVFDGSTEHNFSQRSFAGGNTVYAVNSLLLQADSLQTIEQILYNSVACAVSGYTGIQNGNSLGLIGVVDNNIYCDCNNIDTVVDPKRTIINLHENITDCMPILENINAYKHIYEKFPIIKHTGTNNLKWDFEANNTMIVLLKNNREGIYYFAGIFTTWDTSKIYTFVGESDLVINPNNLYIIDAGYGKAISYRGQIPSPYQIVAIPTNIIMGKNMTIPS